MIELGAGACASCWQLSTSLRRPLLVYTGPQASERMELWSCSLIVVVVSTVLGCPLCYWENYPTIALSIAVALIGICGKKPRSRRPFSEAIDNAFQLAAFLIATADMSTPFTAEQSTLS